MSGGIHPTDPFKDSDSLDLMCSHGAEETIGYRVEARVASILHQHPVVLSDGILTDQWREITFTDSASPSAVPRCGRHAAHHDLMPLESARALAWTLVAQHRHCGVECRLVGYRLIVQWSLRRKGVVVEEISEGQPIAKSREDG